MKVRWNTMYEDEHPFIIPSATADEGSFDGNRGRGRRERALAHWKAPRFRRSCSRVLPKHFSCKFLPPVLPPCPPPERPTRALSRVGVGPAGRQARDDGPPPPAGSREPLPAGRSRPVCVGWLARRRRRGRRPLGLPFPSRVKNDTFQSAGETGSTGSARRVPSGPREAGRGGPHSRPAWAESGHGRPAEAGGRGGGRRACARPWEPPARPRSTDSGATPPATALLSLPPRIPTFLSFVRGARARGQARPPGSGRGRRRRSSGREAPMTLRHLAQLSATSRGAPERRARGAGPARNRRAPGPRPVKAHGRP